MVFCKSIRKRKKQGERPCPKARIQFLKLMCAQPFPTIQGPSQERAHWLLTYPEPSCQPLLWRPRCRSAPCDSGSGLHPGAGRRTKRQEQNSTDQHGDAATVLLGSLDQHLTALREESYSALVIRKLSYKNPHQAVGMECFQPVNSFLQQRLNAKWAYERLL